MTTLLAVTAHPDDEAFLFGGALAMHARAGGRSGLLCLTDGQAGRTGGLVEPKWLGAVRRIELRRACARLGIFHLFTPGYADGALEQTPDDVGAALVGRYADEFRADVLLTFGPDGASGHPDHKCCWRWTRAVAQGRRLYAASHPVPGRFRGGEPLPVTTVVDIAPLGDLKRQAFLEHRTQQDHLELFDNVTQESGSREYYHRVLPPWAEGDADEASLLP
ncbi:MAG: PIG-L deacetylase family protein [Planctomycetota bacterium]|jgi:LmbE family N-acetylglucosaminyl deacetylase